MENAVSVQTVEFFASALLGISLGVFYDALRIIRSYMRKTRAITSFFDALFWVCAIFALFTFVLTYTEGRMRWYILFGAFCGGFVYLAAASEIVFKVGRVTTDALVAFLSSLTKPIYFILSRVRRFATKMRRRAFASARRKRDKNKRKADKVGGKEKKKKEYFS